MLGKALGTRDLGSNLAQALSTSLAVKGRLKPQSFGFLGWKVGVEIHTERLAESLSVLLVLQVLEGQSLPGKPLCCGQPHPSCLPLCPSPAQG